jgi:hypothetical protein
VFIPEVGPKSIDGKVDGAEEACFPAVVGSNEDGELAQIGGEILETEEVAKFDLT